MCQIAEKPSYLSKKFKWGIVVDTYIELEVRKLKYMFMGSLLYGSKSWLALMHMSVLGGLGFGPSYLLSVPSGPRGLNYFMEYHSFGYRSVYNFLLVVPSDQLYMGKRR